MICGRNSAFEKIHKKLYGEEWENPQKKSKKKKKDFKQEREIKRRFQDDE